MDFWVYDGSDATTGWRQITTLWAYDGSDATTGWRQITEAWVCDGASGWHQVYETVDPATLDSAFMDIGEDGGDGCGAGKCVRCVEWDTTSADDADHHIRILRSVSAGSYFEVVDDYGIEAACSSCGTTSCSRQLGQGIGCWCDVGCQSDGISTQYKVRLEVDGTDDLVGNSVERPTGSLSDCAVI